MKKPLMSKRIMTGLLIALMVSALVIPSALADAHGRMSKDIEVETGIYLSLDGLPFRPNLTTGQPAEVFIYSGTTYLPARSISEALGVDIAWRGDESRVLLGRDNVADAKKYLAHYFDVGTLGGNVTWSALNSAYEKIGFAAVADVEATAVVTMPEAVKATLVAAGMREVALTYPADKVTKALKAYRVSGVPADYAAYVAAALDASLVPRNLDYSAKLDGDTAYVLMMNAVEAAGLGRRYLGYTTDSDIYAKVRAAWNSFTLLDEASLDEVGRGVVEEGATTGYLLTYSGNNPKFIPEYTIVYDHGNIAHANQLLALLSSEGISARVQLQPKKSVYEYNLAWGPIRPPTPTYRVEQVHEDLYLANTVGYMLTLEFMSAADKAAFDEIVVEFAKKSGDNSAAIGVILGSYWQPQYSSKTPMAASGNAGYIRMDDVTINHNGYTLNSFILPDNTDVLVDAAEEINAQLDVEVFDVWANAAFYRYLTGESHD